MAEILKQSDADALQVQLVGVVNEKTRFREELGIPPRRMVVNCRRVTRLNSMGVKLWIQYFGAAVAQGCRLKFQECTIPIVEQLNSISNFASGAEVESFYIPYVCTQCDAELTALVTAESIRGAGFDPGERKCSKCGGRAKFDDDPDYYFLFLKRS